MKALGGQTTERWKPISGDMFDEQEEHLVCCGTDE